MMKIRDGIGMFLYYLSLVIKYWALKIGKEETLFAMTGDIKKFHKKSS